MQLETERLLLREFVDADWEAVAAYQQEERYWRYYERPQTGGAGRRELVRAFVAQQAQQPRRGYQLAIILKEQQRLIGNAGVRIRRLVDFGSPEASFEADIGYELDPAYWGRGYATEAARRLVEFAFRDLGVHRLWAYVLVENEPSWRVLERLGFRREGHLRENEWMQGRYWDTYIYGLLAGQWK
ncbi:MAG TPA: GNAT family protein [Dehalococcoidia bacterium]|nr:GNAT family protein [Dehalococcoidia bacterium]